jgi:hypothetical protein
VATELDLDLSTELGRDTRTLDLDDVTLLDPPPEALFPR